MPDREAKHILKLSNLAIGYGKEALLRDLHLTVRPGEMVALIGRNGTGKSTLLKSMIGLLPLLDGSCLLDGSDLESYDLKQRAKKVSYVASNLTQLPSISVRELVALGRMPYTGFLGRLTAKDQRYIERSLKEVGMESFTGRNLEHLSDGERQRCLIARALAQDTPLMVLDEPTAFLDIPNKYDLIQLLSGFRDQGKSIVYSTHDLETAMFCADKIWVIYGGDIREGAPEDLGISGLFDRLFQASGVSYDQESSRFKQVKASKGKIRLEGREGRELRWTRNALERLGFQLEPSAAVHILLKYDGSVPTWVLNHHDQNQEFPDVYSLARFLNHIE
jgi:iron complex transport system ATP-binding protein